MRTNGDVRCGDCEHYSEEGCEQAAEALVLEGWPRASVCPDHSAEAARCPEFSPGADLALVLDEERSGREESARVAAIRSFMSW